MTKEYSNGEVTVVWKPEVCIHSAVCFRNLPEVFDPKKRPWVEIQGATTERIIAQVDKCPSSALSYYRNGKQDQSAVEHIQTVVEPLPNGPLLVYGTIKVKDKTGHEEIKNKTTAFCRCGASANKPYCDGSHVRVGFKDAEV